MTEFPTFKGLWPWPWIGSYCIPSCITHRPLPTYQSSFKSKKLFVDVRIDEQNVRPTLLGRLRGVDLKSITCVRFLFLEIIVDHNHHISWLFKQNLVYFGWVYDWYHIWPYEVHYYPSTRAQHVRHPTSLISMHDEATLLSHRQPTPRHV